MSFSKVRYCFGSVIFHCPVLLFFNCYIFVYTAKFTGASKHFKYFSVLHQTYTSDVPIKSVKCLFFSRNRASQL